MKQFYPQHFKKGLYYSFILGIIILSASLLIGKIELFLRLNTNMGIVADYFFVFFTELGDGYVWILLLLIVLFILKRKDAWPLLVSSFILSTVIRQICKYWIIPRAPRPWTAIPDHSLFHHVSFVEPLLISSFPSGHTATAFSIYMVLCLLIKEKWWVLTGLLYAMLVGYSRLYLAQHFPIDVGAGIMVAIASVGLSFPVQKLWTNRKK
ncbi:MAG TPA: phosphatase PAP2 family protein [Chitinophagaceae bacterium]|nr:phosphatase PAP2 family protein [Chitinophagaceae bacterium]